MRDYICERKGQTMTRRLSVIVRASIGSPWQSPSTVIARLSVRKAVAISKGKNFTCIEIYFTIN